MSVWIKPDAHDARVSGGRADLARRLLRRLLLSDSEPLGVWEGRQGVVRLWDEVRGRPRRAMAGAGPCAVRTQAWLHDCRTPQENLTNGPTRPPSEGGSRKGAYTPCGGPAVMSRSPLCCPRNLNWYCAKTCGVITHTQFCLVSLLSPLSAEILWVPISLSLLHDHIFGP